MGLYRRGIDPDMRMGDFFAHDAGMHLVDGAEGVLHRAGNFCYDLKIRTHIRYVPYPAIVLLWYHLRMARRLRSYVEEGEEIVIFVDNFRWNLSFHYFAKDAVGHTGTIASEAFLNSKKYANIHDI